MVAYVSLQAQVLEVSCCAMSHSVLLMCAAIRLLGLA